MACHAGGVGCAALAPKPVPKAGDRVHMGGAVLHALDLARLAMEAQQEPLKNEPWATMQLFSPLQVSRKIRDKEI